MKKILLLVGIILIFALNVLCDENIINDGMTVNKENNPIRGNLIIDIGPTIPLEQNAYNLLWGTDVCFKATFSNLFSIMFGGKLYFGNAKAATSVENGTKYLFGIQKDKSYLSESSIYQGFSDVGVTYYYIGCYFGGGFNFSVWERNLSVSLKLGFGGDNEDFSGKLIGQNDIESLGNYNELLIPIDLEFMAEAFKVWDKRIYLTLDYSLILGFEFNASELIRIGLGMEI